MLSLIERGFFFEVVWIVLETGGNTMPRLPSLLHSPQALLVSLFQLNVEEVLTGVSKGSFESKNTTESKPLVAVFLHKRKEGKHEERSPWQALSQGTGATTES